MRHLFLYCSVLLVSGFAFADCKVFYDQPDKISEESSKYYPEMAKENSLRIDSNSILANELRDKGYSIVRDSREADIYIGFYFRDGRSVLDSAMGHRKGEVLGKHIEFRMDSYKGTGVSFERSAIGHGLKSFRSMIRGIPACKIH